MSAPINWSRLPLYLLRLLVGFGLVLPLYTVVLLLAMAGDRLARLGNRWARRCEYALDWLHRRTSL